MLQVPYQTARLQESPFPRSERGSKAAGLLLAGGETVHILPVTREPAVDVLSRSWEPVRASVPDPESGSRRPRPEPFGGRLRRPRCDVSATKPSARAPSRRGTGVALRPHTGAADDATLPKTRPCRRAGDRQRAGVPRFRG